MDLDDGWIWMDQDDFKNENYEKAFRISDETYRHVVLSGKRTMLFFKHSGSQTPVKVCTNVDMRHVFMVKEVVDKLQGEAQFIRCKIRKDCIELL